MFSLPRLFLVALVAAAGRSHITTPYASAVAPQPIAVFGENPNFKEEEEENKVLKEIVEEHRHRLLIEYENKIRFFSQPEKVFDYFGSVEVEGERFMTQEDLVLALTPSMQRPQHPTQSTENQDLSFLELLLASTKAPGASGSVTGGFAQSLSIEQYKSLQASSKHKRSSTRFNALELMDASGDGLISFNEFALCRTFLSISGKDLGVAFDVFDANGNGEVDAQEFEQMVERFRNRNDAVRGTLMKTSSVSADCTSLLDHFFGVDRKGKITFQQFSAFINGLQDQVFELEFKLKLEQNAEDSKEENSAEKSTSIAMEDFAELVVSHVQRSDKYVERLKGKLICEQDITLEEWLIFNKFMRALCDVEKAVLRVHVPQGESKIKFSQFLELSRALLGPGAPVRVEMLAVVFLLLDCKGDDDPSVNVDSLFELLKGRADRFRRVYGNAEIARQAQCGWKCFRHSQ